MAGYQNWMNPNPQAAHMDRLLNSRAGVMGEREQTRERVDPRWNLPWQGNADFVTSMPGGQQSNLGAPAFNMERTMVPFEDEEYFGAGRGAPAFLPGEVPQTQRPAKPVTRFPLGESMNRTPIANNFMDRIKSMFGTRGPTY